MVSWEAQSPGKAAKTGLDPRTKISNLLKGKEKEWTAVVEKKGPLRLLDLPIDVLKEIVKEITHTNDLTALALTHSALHNIAIPHIYSRFDIVWPDAHATTDPRTGVDALTYGLATLCMGDIYTGHSQGQTFKCVSCGTFNTADCSHDHTPPQNGRRRLGNEYPQFTRKFSLGNGPSDWVQEYLITKESGKMLGTLVALAIARMINLEIFVWDMPTGVLRDVWIALSSLQTRNAKNECRLERVWVRWHDNSGGTTSSAVITPQMLASSQMTSVGWIPTQGMANSPHTPSETPPTPGSRVEYPTLSILPPLKSLSVLDIDELNYLDEMSVLIAKSKDCLRELRVGIASTANNRDFTLAWDAPGLEQVDHKTQWPGAISISDKRLGGVLGVILGRIYDIRKTPKQENKKPVAPPATSTSIITGPNYLGANILSPPGVLNDLSAESILEESESVAELGSQGKINPINSTSPINAVGHLSSNGASTASANLLTPSDIDSLTAVMSANQMMLNGDEQALNSQQPHETSNITIPQFQTKKHFDSTELAPPERERLRYRLRLQTLELERVSLSVYVLQKGFDWSVLTNLTIFDCPQHERLWLTLRRQFQPTPFDVGHTAGRPGSGSSFQYYLNLKKVHTDVASTALILFLKETLAPNTLEILFLQDRRRTTGSGVTIDSIYRGPLKRHRTSLKKLLLDSSDRLPREPHLSSEHSRWRIWVPNRDILNFITSGRMTSLRELSIAIDYKDWHHFLQRLPNMPHICALNIPYIADHVTREYEPRELALQIVDVIVLRPEVELSYMGISHKCFEIRENRPHDDSHTVQDSPTAIVPGDLDEAITDEENEDERSDEDDADDEDSGTAIVAVDPDETESEYTDSDPSDTDSHGGSDDGRSKVWLTLREILFYDDKVAIFKARHAKL